MTENSTPVATRSPAWMRILLGVSLAMNLLVVGLAVGAAIRFGGLDHDARPTRSLTGALYRELPGDDRKALFRQARSEAGHHKKRHGEDAAEVDAILRAETFDPGALDAVISRQADAREAWQLAVRAAWLERVGAMTLDERVAYADRLIEATKKRHKDKK